ncbi:MAG: hypothetical protein HZA89_00515 [Verrucomicrobia bacterium]|nr:hypothetical protein [Verrucomicrobiota bacterium]
MRFSLDQFGGVLRITDAAGLPYILIGGQAVNYWATRYLAVEPALAAWQPFTSRDVDFYGNREDVLRMAAGLGVVPRFPHRRMMTAFAGAIPWGIGGSESSIELIRRVPGVTANEINKFAVTHEYAGRLVRVMDVISLLACKLNLAFTVDQADRRDTEHAKISLICVRAFLREILQGVEAGALPARGWLGAAERVLKLAESTTGRKAARQLGLNWRQALPEAEVIASPHRRIARFCQTRLPQWLEKTDRRDSHQRA